MNNPKEIYMIFCKLFPQFVDDIESYTDSGNGTIILRRKTIRPRPVYIFTYRSEKDWELIYF